MFLKFLISFLLFSVMLGVIFWVMDYTGAGGFSREVVGIFFGILAVYVLGTFFFFIVKPIRTVLSQMQLVMNGKKFKKLYTKRVDEVGVLAHFFNQVTEGFTKVEIGRAHV